MMLQEPGTSSATIKDAVESIPVQPPAAIAATEAPPRQASLEAWLEQQEPLLEQQLQQQQQHHHQQQQPDAQALQFRVRQLRTLRPAPCSGSSTSQPGAGGRHGLCRAVLTG